ncbi:hypothetical protein FSP39_020994 [Pinctada imbricata]|uniref:Mab-21-like nucleotidyltransferase domain-containing protein n=1 Tax=Pinctada imbricata TaxID=66713 RepID=A0AA89BPR1_PINIB|nr:hypothetical protein FSP39_020994 [Pinctada imbricata]
MAASSEQTEISLISRGSYRLVSDVIGPECHVKLRRNRYELFDRLLNCDTNSESTRITGGSTVEGFEFMSSDFDFIFVNREVSVVTNSILSYNHNLTFPILFVMESEECYPGYTLLRCLKCVSWNILLCNALVLKANNLYVSGKVIKETFMPHSFAQEHGPCKSFKHYIEIDMAYTLRCPFWPTQAMSFVTRSIERGWPSYQVLKDVMNDGCLLVPISSKQQTCSDLVDLEWRISFSLAEKRLIYSMNHSQFLCYGLSKIFLNEILKDIPVVDDLLCSYFMKTAVLWEISDSQHGKYHKAIDMLHYIKHRLHSQPYMYIWDLDDDIIKDTRQQGMPYDILIKSFILDTVEVDSFTSMEQLQLECHAKVRLTGLDYLNIPLFVHIDFLLFLSYSSLEENQRRYAILEELHDLVYYDNGYHIHNYHKAISWEILGICQQICGDCQGALKSYRNALNEEENFFKEATLTRIQSLFIQS